MTSAIEHHAVLHACQQLEKDGWEVTYVGVDSTGIIRLDELKAAVRPDTVLVTVMYANNEVGSIQPISEIGAFCRERRIPFHTDAVQAAGKVPIDVDADGVDFLAVGVVCCVYEVVQVL